MKKVWIVGIISFLPLSLQAMEDTGEAPRTPSPLLSPRPQYPLPAYFDFREEPTNTKPLPELEEIEPLQSKDILFRRKALSWPLNDPLSIAIDFDFMKYLRDARPSPEPVEIEPLHLNQDRKPFKHKSHPTKGIRLQVFLGFERFKTNTGKTLIINPRGEMVVRIPIDKN